MSQKPQIFQPKAEVEFILKSHSLKEILVRSTENINSKLWNHVFNYSVDLNVFQGRDFDLNTPLDQLKNKRLVHSLILHFLGRGIFCSAPVVNRFKQFLKKRLKETTTELNQSNLRNVLSKLRTYTNHPIEEIMAPYNQSTSEFQKWSSEKIPWDQYCTELSFRQLVMNKLNEKFTKYDIRDSPDFFIDFLANLHFDNLCFKSLKRSKGNPNQSLLCERSMLWIFPLDIEIKVAQKRETFAYRRDSVMVKKKKGEFERLQMDNIDKDLDPYMHGGHIRSLFDNEPLELEYYMKKHPGRQLIAEVAYIMFGVEVQKNPAALIYNMMILDLIDGDKVSQREVFYSGDPEHSKEKGNGGIAPYSFDGATTASRYLNIYYSFLFNHWYSYDITEENEEKIIGHLMNPHSDYNTSKKFTINIEEMFQREYDLINKWITFKKERDRKARYLKTIHDLYNYIYNKTVEFFESYKFDVKEVFPKSYP